MKGIDPATMERMIRRASGGGDFAPIQAIMDVCGVSQKTVWRKMRAAEVPTINGRRARRYYIPRAAQAMCSGENR